MKCSKCQIEKPDDAFYQYNGKPYGSCKSCKKEYNREYKKTPQYKEYKREYQKTPQGKEYQKEYRDIGSKRSVKKKKLITLLAAGFTMKEATEKSGMRLKPITA